ncbi:hypothetical protein LEMLEM_LOCUS13945, partial [Lemmus lemmus]
RVWPLPFVGAGEEGWRKLTDTSWRCLWPPNSLLLSLPCLSVHPARPSRGRRGQPCCPLEATSWTPGCSLETGKPPDFFK